jgi:membrane peptidoglycan carboxypeptidase
VALAELIGILVNDGVRKPNTELSNIHFARGTPYETVFERKAEPGQQVLLPEVARTVRKAMAGVVESGTARRLNGVFRLSDGKLITVGGKTGSGDNRIETFNRWGNVTSSRATNRTAAFVFYIGDRYFGVVTAYVQGREAESYHFTSALPVTIVKLLAPTIIAKLEKNAVQQPAAPTEAIKSDGSTRKIDLKISKQSYSGSSLAGSPSRLN